MPTPPGWGGFRRVPAIDLRPPLPLGDVVGAGSGHLASLQSTSGPLSRYCGRGLG